MCVCVCGCVCEIVAWSRWRVHSRYTFTSENECGSIAEKITQTIALFSYFLAILPTNGGASKYRTILTTVSRGSGAANKESRFVNALSRWETMILYELEGTPRRAARKEDKAERGEQSFAIKIARRLVSANRQTFGIEGRQCSSGVVRRCLVVNWNCANKRGRVQAEAALEINIESSFVEIAGDADSINRDAKIQTRPATIGSQIIEVPTVI